jgi:NTE family protein
LRNDVAIALGRRWGMKIGLALSGGEIRAAVFHLGVLRRLADQDLLETTSQISTVSGGSLVLAALMCRADMSWPSSAEYRALLYPALRKLLTTTDLFSIKAIGWVGALRFNRRLINDRARVLADLLEQRWGVTGDLRGLPDQPVWWINTTSLETEKNWRFAKRELGDWQFGRHYNPAVRLADAAAASAAVPYVIGALTLALPSDVGTAPTPPLVSPSKGASRRQPRFACGTVMRMRISAWKPCSSRSRD